MLKKAWAPAEMDAAGERAPACGPWVDDCLYLEIYTKKVDQTKTFKPMPITVWIHGGHFAGGSNAQYSDTGFMRNLASKDVVVVSIQYRLDIMGWWTTKDNAAAGNWGLWDQLHALKWMQQEIHHFGGDPARVTIHGESAGGASSSYLNRSPHAHADSFNFSRYFDWGNWKPGNQRPLLQYAIPQSGCGMNIWASQSETKKQNKPGFKLDAHDDLARSLLLLLSCLRKTTTTTATYRSCGCDKATTEETANCMRFLPHHKIKTAWSNISNKHVGFVLWPVPSV